MHIPSHTHRQKNKAVPSFCNVQQIHKYLEVFFIPGIRYLISFLNREQVHYRATPHWGGKYSNGSSVSHCSTKMSGSKEWRNNQRVNNEVLAALPEVEGRQGASEMMWKNSLAIEKNWWLPFHEISVSTERLSERLSALDVNVIDGRCIKIQRQLPWAVWIDSKWSSLKDVVVGLPVVGGEIYTPHSWRLSLQQHKYGPTKGLTYPGNCLQQQIWSMFVERVVRYSLMIKLI